MKRAIFPSETCLEIGCNKGLCVFICTTVKRVQTADLCRGKEILLKNVTKII